MLVFSAILSFLTLPILLMTSKWQYYWQKVFALVTVKLAGLNPAIIYPLIILNI